MMSQDQLLKTLANHIGKANGIHVKQLVMEITGDCQSNSADERMVRELVNRLRMEGHHVCGTPSSGYYMAQTEEELNETCHFLYERAMTSLRQVARMKDVTLPDLRGQLRLPL